MLAPVLNIVPLTTIVRERTLPVAGKVNARLEQRVSPTDVIAEASFAREHVWLDVARTFGISPGAADKLLKVKPGDRLEKDALIAEGRGFMARPIKAPRPGHVMVAGGGQVLMEVGNARIELHAGMPGVVTQIIPDRGVVIRTAGALIQGTWGNGRVDNGTMVNLIDKPDAVLAPERIDINMRGSVILGGHVRDADTLRNAAELPVRGLILSSMMSALLPLAMQMRYPILVLDGFGAMPMNTAAYNLLTSNSRREVTVNAEPFDRYNGNRPEVIIPLPVSNEPAEPNTYLEFAVGQRVRMRRSPNAGMLGTLIGLPPGSSPLPSGLRARSGEVKLEDGTNVLVPLVNLEVVG